MDDPLNGHHTRLILPALCWSRYRPDFYAVTTDLSVAGLRFRAASIPGLGETLTCSLRHAGTLEVLVVHRNTTAFVARVRRADVAIPVMVRRLLDLAEDQDRDLAPRRVHPRFVPDRPDILVTTASGVQVPGRLINVSASGAALQVDIRLEPGMQITLGRTPATVARRFEDGIGAAFLEPLARENIGPHVSL
ncbi:PilZ domain-containing protein [Methylobacterium sp.]|jgi:hypothetical protein|uniref:PilZ domain-containing protein n=1 Tax=Methylobacterium sp. TaxID=409 RepID=UPI0025D96A08|nr:PilZ domain-containing protein [Methylobacterium sp.]MBY0256376.1 PilZ domain-containing protein [Methylobacterium sp.]